MFSTDVYNNDKKCEIYGQIGHKIILYLLSLYQSTIKFNLKYHVFPYEPL